jgi:hypothetical protein
MKTQTRKRLKAHELPSQAGMCEPVGETPQVSTVAPNGQRPNSGRFTPGHTRGRLPGGTGLYSDHLPRDLEYIAAEVERFNTGSLVDEGDVDEIPTRRRSQLQYRGLVHRNIHAVAGALAQRGLVDRRGKLRVQWISKLESLIATAVRIDNLLGLERRPKNANALNAESAEEFLRLARLSDPSSDRPDGDHHHESNEADRTATTPRD